MPKLEQRKIKRDVSQAEQTLSMIAHEYGKESLQYRRALKQFSRLWFVLRLTRANEEFFQEISSR